MGEILKQDGHSAPVPSIRAGAHGGE